MTQHTQGPWVYEYDNDVGPNDDYFEEFFTVYGEGSIEVSRAHKVEDARLIAAAPDLLEALQGMVDRFSDRLMDSQDQPKTFGCHHTADTCPNCKGLVSGWKAVQAARAAIAKATGESK